MSQKTIRDSLQGSKPNQRKSKNPFRYYFELSACAKKEGDSYSFLESQFKKIMPVIKDSVLQTYLNELDLPASSVPDQKPLFPFGCNASQTKAVAKAMSEKLSVIQGPPGTGKTQTILNIIANAIMEGKTVAVVSNNNAATENVAEKLTTYGLGFLVASLGNKGKREAFFASQPLYYPDFKISALAPKEHKRMKNWAHLLGDRLEQYLEMQNERAKLKQELAEAKIQRTHFKEFAQNQFRPEDITYPTFLCRPYIKGFNIVLTGLPASDSLKKFLKNFRRVVLDGDGKTTFSLKLRYLIEFKLFYTFFNNSNESIVLIIEHLFYKKKIEELEARIAIISKLLFNVNFTADLDDFTATSMKLFKGFLVDKYGISKATKSRRTFTMDTLWKNTFKNFQNEYPIILSTTHAIRSCMPPGKLFDYVIIDEASQVDMLSGCLALSSAKQAIVVGDLKQLPNIVSKEMKTASDFIFMRHNLPAYNDYTKQSLLSSLVTKYPHCPKTLLKEHYRCHPLIIGYCNHKFYNNELVIMTEGDETDNALVVYKTPVGNHQRGTFNQREIDIIINEVIPKHVPTGTDMTVGVVSPYRKQTDKLAQRINGYQVDTVHKFQGRERDIIILSTVANQKNAFVDNANLINVAVSRAVKKLILVVSGNQAMLNSKIGDIVKYAQYNNCEIVESSVYSVFDLLYGINAYDRRKYIRQCNNKESEDSETLYRTVIEKVLKLPQFCDLGIASQIPLNRLVKDLTLLTQEELVFVKNVQTSTDFMIFSRVTKEPVLVIEVDGYSFHEANPEQLVRDEKKNSVLSKCKIPLLRSSTVGSQEEKVLTERLATILDRG
ncbi:MAG: DNA helicase [Desulfotalea sp.]|nr:MAG: DNA helicase [Desulfotalea sp.]